MHRAACPYLPVDPQPPSAEVTSPKIRAMTVTILRLRSRANPGGQCITRRGFHIRIRSRFINHVTLVLNQGDRTRIILLWSRCAIRRGVVHRTACSRITSRSVRSGRTACNRIPDRGITSTGITCT